MAIDLGDTYQLAVFVTDDNGAAANAGACTVTVTLPDLTTVLPAVTNGAVGTYTASFPTTLPGHHDVRWVATGVNACTYSDEFNVVPADAGGIISLDEARSAVGVVGTSKDESLRSVIAAATPIIEDIVGAVLSTPRVETYDGGSSQIVLLWGPVLSVTGIIESFGTNYQRTLTAQNMFGVSNSDSFGYTFEPLVGTVTRRSTGIAIPFAAGRRNIQITYVSGRNPIPGNILLAARRLIRHLWSQEQQSFRPNVLSQPEPMTTTPSGFAVPTAVVELCAPHARPPSLA